MLIDQTLVLSDQQAVTATAASTHTADLGGGDVVHGLFVVARVGTAFAGLTDLKIELETADDAEFAASKQLFAAEYEVADLTADKTLLKVCLPLGCKKYLRGKYTVTGTGTAGTIDLFLTDNPGVEG